jgi:hypothetical protein
LSESIELLPVAEPATAGSDAAITAVSEPVLRVINGHRNRLARVEVTQDGESFYVVAKTRAKYKTFRALQSEDTLPAAFCSLVTENNLVDMETGDLIGELTEDSFGNVDFGLLVKLVQGVAKAIANEGN